MFKGGDNDTDTGTTHTTEKTQTDGQENSHSMIKRNNTVIVRLKSTLNDFLALAVEVITTYSSAIQWPISEQLK